MEKIPFNIEDLKREIVEKFTHAGGPGGQNVNKVATCVQLKFVPTQSNYLSEKVKHRLKIILGKRLSPTGIWVLSAQRFRTREQNRRDAWERLFAWIEKAYTVPKPRKKTRPTRSSIERRLELKTLLSDKKKKRREKFI